MEKHAAPPLGPSRNFLMAVSVGLLFLLALNVLVAIVIPALQ